MTRLKPYHFHPVLFALFPVLALLGHNIEEVALTVALRPLLVSLLGAALIFLFARLLVKCWDRTALATSYLLILFFSYGHVYNALRSIPEYGLNLGRHRYLVVIYVGALFAGLWWLFRRLRDLRFANQWASLIGLVLIVSPLIQIISHSRKVSMAETMAIDFSVLAEPLSVDADEDLPDIYYIILDTYTRADSLRENYGYDNTPFLDYLRSLGFFVAECSRCNHCYTHGSLVSALNMNYIGVLSSTLEAYDLGDDLWVLLKHSIVRESLEQIGYQIISFDTGFEWSRLRDVDIYLAFDQDPLRFQAIEPFETLFIKSTAGLIWTDMQYKSIRNENQALLEPVSNVNFPFEGYAKRQLFILDHLPQLPPLPGPKFVFAHILIPHVPRIFTPEGEILTDPGYYSGELDGAVDDEYDRKGYLSEIEFISNRMREILPQLIENSASPPIIILQADTGSRHDVTNILNAYYLRGDQHEGLFDSISPVNTFRFIFDAFFGTNYGLLPDITYDNNEVIPETSATCVQ